MIFEQEQFDNYCNGQSYHDSLLTHVLKFDAIAWIYKNVFGKPMADWLRKQFFLDAGCAMGHFMEELVDHGVECEGYEPSNYANDHLLESMRERIWQADHDTALPEMSPGEYDIIYANSLQYSHDEEQIGRWVKDIARICSHSLFFCGVTTQGLHRAVSGPDIWKMQIIKPQKWWTKIFFDNGFEEVCWKEGVIAVCLKEKVDNGVLPGR